jgi:hypothetical protein
MKKSILAKAGVLIIGVVIFFSSVAAIATTSDKTNLIAPVYTMDIPIRIAKLGASSNVLWDNWNENWSGGIAAQHEPPGTPDRLDAFPADDFMFDEETAVYRVFWGGDYFNCNLVGGPKDYHFDWNITFFEDDGTGNNPGNVFAGPFTLYDADIVRSEEVLNDTGLSSGLWACGFNAWLPDPVTFNADTKYWITIYGINETFPQTGVARHNESLGGILLHEAKFKSDYFGFPEWTNLSEVLGEESMDLNFALLGPDPDFDVTLAKGLGVSATITNQGLFDTTNVTATFTATGGLVLGRTKVIDIEDLNLGDTGTAKAIFLGIGSIAVDVEIGDFWGQSGYGNTTGLLLLFFIL